MAIAPSGVSSLLRTGTRPDAATLLYLFVMEYQSMAHRWPLSDRQTYLPVICRIDHLLQGSFVLETCSYRTSVQHADASGAWGRRIYERIHIPEQPGIHRAAWSAMRSTTQIKKQIYTYSWTMYSPENLSASFTHCRLKAKLGDLFANSVLPLTTLCFHQLSMLSKRRSFGNSAFHATSD